MKFIKFIAKNFFTLCVLFGGGAFVIQMLGNWLGGKDFLLPISIAALYGFYICRRFFAFGKSDAKNGILKILVKISSAVIVISCILFLFGLPSIESLQGRNSVASFAMFALPFAFLINFWATYITFKHRVPSFVIDILPLVSLGLGFAVAYAMVMAFTAFNILGGLQIIFIVIIIAALVLGSKKMMVLSIWMELGGSKANDKNKKIRVDLSDVEAVALSIRKEPTPEEKQEITEKTRKEHIFLQSLQNKIRDRSWNVSDYCSEKNLKLKFSGFDVKCNYRDLELDIYAKVYYYAYDKFVKDPEHVMILVRYGIYSDALKMRDEYYAECDDVPWECRYFDINVSVEMDVRIQDY